MNQKKIIIAVISLSFLSFACIGYVTFNPDQENPGMVRFISLNDLSSVTESERIRLGGRISAGSIQISKQNQLECDFGLQQGELTVPVNFLGTRPDLFKDDAEVIVEGHYVNEKFVADQLQTKCASRYEGDLRDDSSYNVESI